MLILALGRNLTYLLFPAPFGTARSRFLPFLGCRPAHPPPVPAVRFLHSRWCRSTAAAASPVFRSSDGATAELHGWLRVPSLSLGSALPCFLNLYFPEKFDGEGGEGSCSTSRQPILMARFLESMYLHAPFVYQQPLPNALRLHSCIGHSSTGGR